MNSGIKTSLRACLNAERLRWQLAGGWLAGWPMLGMAATAIVLGWVMFLYLLLHPLRWYVERDRYVLTSVAAIAISVAFLGAILAIIIVWRQRREHGLLRLLPNAGPLIVGLNARLALVGLLCLPPAIALRPFMNAKFPNSLDSVMALSDVPMQDFLSSGLMLACTAALIVATFGWLRAPVRFAGFPLYWGAMQWSTSTWRWLPLVACVIIVIGHRIWLRTDFASVAPSQAPTPSASGLAQLWERYRALRMRRAARLSAAGNQFAAARALIGTRPRALFTLVAVLATVFYFSVGPNAFEVSTPGWFFAFMVMGLFATPTPIPMTTILLMPIGVDRGDIGRLLMDVWMQDVHFRFVVGVICGLAVRALLWWLEMLPFMRSPGFEALDTLTLLLWGPLAHAVGLYGAARSICWLCSASPRLLTNATLLNLLPMIFVALFSLLGVAVVWLLTGSPLRISRSDGQLGSVLFMAYGAGLLPAVAWLINRALRYEWQTANMATIAAAMQAWAARRQKSLSPQ